MVAPSFGLALADFGETAMMFRSCRFALALKVVGQGGMAWPMVALGTEGAFQPAKPFLGSADAQGDDARFMARPGIVGLAADIADQLIKASQIGP